MRIYVQRPWFLSGPGERLAVGCRVGQLDAGPRSMLDKYATQWGEDPVERANSRLLCDRRVLPTLRCQRAGLDPQLDQVLIPGKSIKGSSSLLYS